MKSAATPVPLAKCDATENKKVAERYGVQGFPTLKFFNKGQAVDFNGGRTDKDIQNWITKRTGTLLATLASAAEFDKFKEDNLVCLVFFASSADGDKTNIFKSVAMGFDKINFAIVTDPAVIAHAQAQVDNVVLYKKFDEGKNEFSGDFTVEALKTFADTNSFATVMEFDDRAIEKVFQQGNPTIFLFADETEESLTARKTFEVSAKAHKGGKVLFSISRPNDGHGHFQRLADYVGANTKKVPCIMLVEAKGEVTKYRYTEEITKENLDKFMDDYYNRKLEKYMKSEEIPESQEGPVSVIVGKNFQSAVIDNDKDVLIKFYAPWCGHCKQLAPKWDAAALKLKANKNIVIAKCDATANEVPGVNIKGFPTLKFYPGNAKGNPIDFDGDRSEEGIIKFLKDHTT